MFLLCMTKVMLDISGTNQHMSNLINTYGTILLCKTLLYHTNPYPEINLISSTYSHCQTDTFLFSPSPSSLLYPTIPHSNHRDGFPFSNHTTTKFLENQQLEKPSKPNLNSSNPVLPIHHQVASQPAFPCVLFPDFNPDSIQSH